MTPRTFWLTPTWRPGVTWSPWTTRSRDPCCSRRPTRAIDGRPPVAPGPAPKLGQHNEAVWGDLIGLAPDELAQLKAAGTI